MGVKCFFLEPTNQFEESLRRYIGSSVKCDASGYGYHNAEVVIDRVELELEHNGQHTDDFRHDDARWPKACACGLEFGDGAKWQHNLTRLYCRSDTGELTTIHGAPPGAMWYADWYSDVFAGPDGRCLVAKCPDGSDWIIDSVASNCTMPDDKEHRCWVRHGTPPNITVDKNGHTCRAGAGSIATPGYHGFLRNGVFT